MNVEQARFNMIEQQIRPWDVLDPEVLALLSIVKREDFVPPACKDLAFADVELPLGNGVTMLEPKLEARLLQEAAVKNTDKVLEIGAGSGYMAALLAARAEFVVTVEIEPSLAKLARENLARAGVVNVSVEQGDASRGWATKAPYDVILVSASLPFVPKELLQQLQVGGRLVAVVGEQPVMSAQLVTRTGESTFNTVNLFETVTAPLRNVAQHEQFVF
ncbi:MAG: protein-L-isoaspartate O-methyltransferase [Betaproteobacteria bacterium]|uniref:Protein-L-isoaspartate O-methyltransferase n=1 Tax=Candidatus Proximibacter danicus TaxID=2954365 RepID=A0A9D7K3B5_9PROT|nr:protein-L-isoaspartate O-methyltransferase [Candidatus Proximibacter danicus]